MKTVGIIAEYNPFHNGHAYQLEQIRTITGADYIIVAMSGDFLQRGGAAIVDKYRRTRMALSAGADLVLEIPAVFASASAEYFASAGVSLLASTGIVDEICYGVETYRPEFIRDITEALVHPSPAFEATLSHLLHARMSYPLARQEALCRQLPQYSGETLRDFLSAPNNILAIEYEKAIAKWNLTGNRPLQGRPMQRVGDGYHDSGIHSGYASATAIRELLLKSRINFDEKDVFSPDSILAGQLPAVSLRLLSDAAGAHQLIDTDDFSDALYTCLLMQRADGYAAYADCPDSLSNRIAGLLDSYTGFSQFAGLLKTKELTYTRICRVLTHILLDIRLEDCAALPQYLRVLGFVRSSRPLLTAITEKASVPLITKVADASGFLSDSAMHMLSKDLYAADLYRGICSIRSGQHMCSEYTQPVTILQ